MANRFSIEAIFKGIDRMSPNIAKMKANLSAFGKSGTAVFKGLNQASSAWFSGMKTVAATTAAIGISGGLALGYLGKAGADFEEQISAVGAVSLLTRDQIADLEKKALELGATTKFTATQAAQGMELMARAGFSNADVLQGIGGILNAAAAEGMELADAANHVSNVLKGMGLATSEASKVADVLALGSSRTNSSIASLGESMANVSSTARQFNIPLEEVVAGVALLQDVGLDASVAGSAMNTMLTKLADPSKKAAQQMKQFGVTFQDAKGNMLPLMTVMENMAKAADKSGGNMDQVAFFAELVGLRGQKAAANLKDMFVSGKFKDLATELKGAAGSAEKMAALRMNNLKGDFNLLRSAVDGVNVALFNTQSGPIRKIVQDMTAWVTANEGLIKSRFVDYVERFKNFLAEAIPVAKAFADGMRQGFNELLPVLEGAYGALNDLFGDDSKKRAENARELGRIAVKVTGYFLAFELASKAVTAAQIGLSFVTNGSAMAMGIAKAATWGVTGAHVLYEGALYLSKLATTGLTGAQIFNTGKSWAMAAATWGVHAAQVAYNFVVGLGPKLIGAVTVAQEIYSVATGKATLATVSANAALGTFLVTIGSAAAAIGGLIAAYDQWTKLSAETGGMGIGEMASTVWNEGLGDMQKGTGLLGAIDKRMNAQAEQRATERDNQLNFETGRDSMFTPGERVAHSISETSSTTSAEVTIRDESGKAQVTKAPKGPGFKLKLNPSGAF